MELKKTSDLSKTTVEKVESNSANKSAGYCLDPDSLSSRRVVSAPVVSLWLHPQ